MDLVTIDGKYSRDLDDAIWVERVTDGHRVTVAVSDVSAVVEMGSELDAAALARGFSTYRAARTVRPMLPRDISEESASLNQGVSRPAVVAEMTLDHTLDVVGLNIQRRDVRIRQRLDHEEALQVAARDHNAIAEMLRLALPLSEALLVRRRKAGAMTFHDPEMGLVMNEEGRVVHFGRAAQAYVLIQEIMIMTNAALARRMAERGAPLLYRNHRARVTADREALMADAALVASGNLDPAVFESRRALVLERAEMGTTIGGHFGLNLPCYAWFTSPIRRYADLVNHRLLLADLAGAPAPLRLEELTAIATSLNELYRRENDDRSRHYKRRALEGAVEQFVGSDPQEMDTASFTQAIKAMSQGFDLGADAIVEMRRRSQTNSLTSKDLFRLLMNDGETAAATRQIVAEHLDRSPHDAYGLFGHAQRTAGWNLATEKVAVGTMPDGTSVFSAEITVHAEGHRLDGAGWASSKKGAMQKALAACLIRLAGLQPPETWSRMPSTARFGATKGERPSAAGANEKGALIAACATRRLAVPAFETVQSGPQHAPKFTCTVRVAAGGEIVQAAGTGTSKKAAEAQAAAAALARIDRMSGARASPQG